jgi:hypothetical protein
MPNFSMPAFFITDLLGLSRRVGRQTALRDAVVAGAAGSVTLGIILGALSKPRQRAGALAAPVLTALQTTVDEDNAVVLIWTATPGASGYNVNQTIAGNPTVNAINGDPLTSTLYVDAGDFALRTSISYTVDAVDSAGTVISSSSPASITIL